jgi:2-dehydropantoate 2-reductase
MRYVIFGAGAVGGVIGGCLHRAGSEVALLARGEHLAAIQDRGLELQTPEGTVILPMRAEAQPAALPVTGDDTVILATKSQDTLAAVAQLAAVAPEAPLICAQNGVENERVALRQLRRVYGMSVFLPATHLAPGVVQAHGGPAVGILDLGCYPSGTDDVCVRVATDLTAAGFSSRPDPAIMRHKYAKLLLNLANALEAAGGDAARQTDLVARAQAEACRCFEAAGIDVAGPEEAEQRRDGVLRLRPIAGQRRQGGSSWQSLARATGRIESDYLNGEVVLLGRLHGVPTPVNDMLQRVANRLARNQLPPGSLSTDDLLAELGS